MTRGLDIWCDNVTDLVVRDSIKTALRNLHEALDRGRADHAVDLRREQLGGRPGGSNA